MKIETRLDKGDKAWFMHNNKPIEAAVKGLTVEFDNLRWNNLTVVRYYFDVVKVGCIKEEISILERDCFPSKQELLNSL